VAKPELEIYHRAIGRLGIDHESAVYIGDGGDDELDGAERSGLRAYRASWFVPNSRLKRAWPELASPQDVLRLVEST
jgi:putative hydrolase of the HAD superfamily